MPVSAELTRYRRPTLQRDLVAGVTVAALAIPSAMAYAEVAGLSPVHGLYALLLPAVVYAVLGSSRQVIVGPEGSVSAIVGATIVGLATVGSEDAAELAAMLALLVALVFAAAWLLKLGWIADYISVPVMVGYLTGIGITLIISQVEKLAGLDVAATDPLPQLWEALNEIGTASAATLVVGVAALVLLIGLRRIAPAVPAALIVVIGSIVVSWAVDLEQRGVAVLGEIPAGMPRLAWPSVAFSDLLTLAPAAMGLFFVVFADGALTARAFAGRANQSVRIRQELLAFGGMHAAAGVSQAFPIGVSGSRTAVNHQMGARTQIAGLLAAGAVAVVLLVLTEPLAFLPSAVLGAVIVSAAVGLIDIEGFRALRATSRFELVIASVTVAGVIAVGALEAIVVAIALAILDTTRRSAHPHDAVLGWVDRLGRWGNVALHPSARLTEGVVVYRLDDRLFFANARYVKGRVGEALRGAPYEARWLVFDAEAVSHVDVTGLETLGDLARTLRSDGVGLVIARMRPHVQERLAAAGVLAEIGETRVFPTVRAAVAWCAEQDVARTGRTGDGSSSIGGGT